MRALMIWLLLSAAGGCCTGPSAAVVSTAMTSVLTQAQVASAAVHSCGADGADRQAACDRVTRSLADLSETSTKLKALADAR